MEQCIHIFAKNLYEGIITQGLKLTRRWYHGKKVVRKVTANKKILLNRLAKILNSFLPLTSDSKNAVTFNSIFKESSVRKYLDGHRIKRQALECGFTEVYRHHARLLQIIIRRVVPAAVNYRLYKRNPLTKEEINELSCTLYELGIDMKKELSEIKLVEVLPRINVPSADLEKRLRNHDLDTKISTEPLQLFSDGHFNEAVRKAMERFEDYVQEITNLDLSGRDLMANAFRDGIYINTCNIQPENQQGFIEGYKFLTMGAMASIRNIFSHGDEERRSPEECFEMLLFINWLFRCIKNTDVQE
jgi:uncharacterized protein (TIGR02391 family)